MILMLALALHFVLEVGDCLPVEGELFAACLRLWQLWRRYRTFWLDAAAVAVAVSFYFSSFSRVLSSGVFQHRCVIGVVGGRMYD